MYQSHCKEASHCFVLSRLRLRKFGRIVKNMAQNQSFDQKLEAIQKLRAAPSSAETIEALRKFLQAKSNVVAAKAANVTAEAGFSELIPDLRHAFHRFMENGIKTDKACIAKIAIIKALRELDDADIDLFRHGIRYTQLEPSYGGRNDSAVEIRCQAAYALVEQSAPDMLYELITLTFDAELAAQIAAVRAMASTGRHEAELLLRMLATSRAGDVTITAECLTGLMQLAPESSFDFVAAYLSDMHETLQQAAALALAQTHSEQAFERLRAHWQESSAFERRQLLLAFATLRLPAALDFLLEIVETEADHLACEAVQALKIYQHDEKVTARLNEAVAAKSSRAVSEAWRRNFG